MKPVPEGHWSSGIDPSKLSEHVVHTNRWDRRDHARMEAEAAELAAATDKIGELYETGRPLMADGFHLLHKAAPELEEPTAIRPSFLINRTVAEEAQELSELRSLRAYTRGDDVASALGAASLEPDFETLLDRQQLLQDEAERLEEMMSQLAAKQADKVDLDELVERWASDEPPEEGEGMSAEEASQAADALSDELAQLMADVDVQGNQVAEKMQQAGPSIRAHLAQALERAIETTQQMSSMTRLWGNEPGVIQRLSAEERLKLAKRLNNDRMKRLAEKFGAIRNLAMTEQMRKTDQAVDEVVAITFGAQLDRVLPSELVKLGGPREDEFFRDFAEGRLPEWELRGKEKVGKGAIIVCEDGSGSMTGEPELWAKAVMLSLLDIARKQKRAFHLIHFGSPGQTAEVGFAKPTDYTVNNILDAAELHFAGGTCFTTPITKAVERLRQEHADTGRTSADIVMITDGICSVTEQFQSWFREEQDRLGFTLWGIIIGMPKESEPLYTLADGKVSSISDLLGGNDARALFRGI